MTVRKLVPYKMPNGWFALGLSSELKANKIWSRRFMGQDLVIFRTKTGSVCAMDAYCPHLGAHLGHGGKIIGELIQCPFHCFCYDTQGQCVSSACKNAKIDTWPVREVNGLIMAYHGGSAKIKPTWEIPALEEEGWSPLYHKKFLVHSHPQEIVENACDERHMATLHHFTKTQVVNDFTSNGPFAQIEYQLIESPQLLGFKLAVTASAKINLWGLGYQLVETTLENYGSHFRLFILPIIQDVNQVELVAAFSYRKLLKNKNSRVFSLINSVLGLMIRNIIKINIVRAIKQDLPIFEHRTFLENPILAPNEGRILEYRKWAQQFY